MQTTTDPNTEFYPWLERASKKCTMLELRSTMAPDSRIEKWGFDETGGDLPALLELVVQAANADAGDDLAKQKLYYVLGFKREEDARQETKFILRAGREREKTTDDTKGILAELKQMVRDANEDRREAFKFVLETSKEMGAVARATLASTGERLAAHERDSIRLWDALREMNTFAADKSRLETQEKKELERTKVGGEMLLMAFPALLGKVFPGMIAGNKTSGELAVIALMRTISDEQEKKIAEHGELQLTQQQLTGAVALYQEIKDQKNGSIASPLLRKLRDWLASLSEEQTAHLINGSVKLTGEQSAAFLEIYIEAGKAHSAREERAVS